MILYTIMPEHVVYPQDESVYYEQKQISYRGIDMIVRQGESGEYIVVRIMSSDPQHFLALSPGQSIPMH
ncbi:YlzJ-like family protein [Ectobacillus polymachus]|uniref:YlzJ-like family protein n=1 Tax=Ectobacillus polymachus TaxID=1508806 RepID=UPI003A868671